MKEDPIVAEVRRVRAANAQKRGNDLSVISEALRHAEAKAGNVVRNRKPKLVLPKTGS